MSKKINEAIVDAAKLRNQAIAEAREALAESLKPSLEKFVGRIKEDLDGEEEIDFDAIEGEMEDEMADDEIKEIVRKYLENADEKLDDYENGVSDEEPFDDETETEYSEQLEAVAQKYGLSENKLLEKTSVIMAELLSEEYNFPSVALLREGRLQYRLKENDEFEAEYDGDDEEIEVDLGEYEMNGYDAPDTEDFEGDDDELEEDDDELDFDLDEALREASQTGDVAGYGGARGFADDDDEETEEDEEEITAESLRRPGGLRNAHRRLFESVEDLDDEDLLSDEDTEDGEEDEEELDLEAIIAEMEAEFGNNDEENSEDEIYEAARQLKKSFRDFRKAPFQDMTLVYSGAPREVMRAVNKQMLHEDKLMKVTEKHGEKYVAKSGQNNLVADRLRKIAGINKMYDEIKEAQGKTPAQLLVEKIDNPVKGAKMKKDNDKDLIIEN